jgi:CRISPR-associated protein Cmr2
LTKDDDLKKEIEADLFNLSKAIKKVSENGVGAKTKLGWGQFQIIDECYSCNRSVSVGLKECEGE